jgi:hypothetical protein
VTDRPLSPARTGTTGRSAGSARPPGAGREGHEPERLGRGRVDGLPHVDAEPPGDDGQLVTNAMLMCRNVFSNSLVSSAVRVDDTATVRSTSRS